MSLDQQGCPSDFVLDSLTAGCLPEAEARAVKAHLDGCAECAARLEALAHDPPELKDAVVLAAMRRAAVVPSGEGWFASPSKIKWVGALALGATAIGLFFWFGQDPKGPSEGTQLLPVTRPKGGVKLAVRRERAGVVERLPSGGELRRGDTLHFDVTLSTKSRVTILGVPPSGTLYTAWPPPDHDGNPMFEAGEAIALPGAVHLNGPRGEELLVLVACPKETAAACASDGPGKTPRCPSGCELSTFKLRR